MAIGGWAGDFGVDAGGRGGLGALKTHAEQRRRTLQAAGGAAFLVHAGNFTGATTAAIFRARLSTPLDIPAYLDFSALGLSPQENEFALSNATAHRLLAGRALSYDYRPRKAPRRRGLRSARIERTMGRTVFFSALSLGTGPSYPEDRIAGLRRAVFGRSGADLHVVLFGRGGANRSAKPGKTPLASAYFGSALKKPAKAGIASFLLPRIPENPHPRLPGPRRESQPPRPVLVIRPGHRANQFFRTADGTFVCDIRGRTLCEVEFRLRGGSLISVQSRFLTLNGAEQPGPWITADPRLNPTGRD